MVRWREQLPSVTMSLDSVYVSVTSSIASVMSAVTASITWTSKTSTVSHGYVSQTYSFVCDNFIVYAVSIIMLTAQARVVRTFRLPAV